MDFWTAAVEDCEMMVSEVALMAEVTSLDECSPADVVVITDAVVSEL